MRAANPFRMARDGHRLAQFADRLTVMRAVFAIASLAIAPITAIVVAVLVSQFERRSGRQAQHDLAVAERLDRLERSLEARRDEDSH
jgi:hypothetical protein